LSPFAAELGTAKEKGMLGLGDGVTPLEAVAPPSLVAPTPVVKLKTIAVTSNAAIPFLRMNISYALVADVELGFRPKDGSADFSRGAI
jgi:hypothetical protein